MRNTYFLLRHGENTHQVENSGVVYPWPEPFPILLTQKGRREVKKAAKELKEIGIDVIYSSDIPRAKETAEIVAKELGLEVKLDKRLRDVNAGVFHGRKAEEFLKFIPLKERLTKRPPGGENWNDVAKRMLDFLREIDKKYKNKKILIVGHKGPLWILEAKVRGLSEEEILEMKKRGLATGQFRKLEINKTK
ncbi:histidine phosphatase family protein [bacterium]|nr:histidine phosphatase family protein [bacterium]